MSVLCHQFRQDPERNFFLPPSKGPTQAPKRQRVREKVIVLRKQNLSIYDISKDPKQWRTNVPHYAKVHYEAVYPGIDLVYYGNQRRLEYDFVVAPGADPKAIRLAFKRADKLRLDHDGNLVLETTGGKVVQQVPQVYQEMNGKSQAIAGRYVLAERGQGTNPTCPYPCSTRGPLSGAPRAVGAGRRASYLASEPAQEGPMDQQLGYSISTSKRSVNAAAPSK
jgi:hypothetical protein